MAALLGFLLAAPLSAQKTAGTETASAAAFEAGDRARVEVAGDGMVEGLVRSVDEQTPTREVEGVDAVRTITFGRVRSASIRTDRTGEGAGIGATGVAGLFGVAAGTLFRGLCDKAVCEGTFTDGFVRGTVIGAAVGASIGAAVGSLLHTWQPVSTGRGTPSGVGRLSGLTGSVRYRKSDLLRSDAPPAVGRSPVRSGGDPGSGETTASGSSWATWGSSRSTARAPSCRASTKRQRWSRCSPRRQPTRLAARSDSRPRSDRSGRGWTGPGRPVRSSASRQRGSARSGACGWAPV